MVEYQSYYEEGLGLCMKQEGFDYTPAELVVSAPSSLEDRDRSYYQEWGLDISTRRLDPEKLEVDFHEEDPRNMDSNAGRTDLPDAYWQALEGPEGCEETAVSYARTEVPNIRFLEALESLTAADEPQQYRQASDVVARCIRDFGFAYGSYQEATGYFEAEATRIESQIRSAESVDKAAVWSQIDDLQALEISTALAYWECGWFPGNRTAEIEQLVEQGDRELVRTGLFDQADALD